MATSPAAGPRRVVLMRHGLTEDHHPEGDRQRRLTPAGADQARRAGQWLRDADAWPQLALVSTAVRTQQTAHGVLSQGPECEVWPEPRLYAADPTTMARLIGEVPDEYASVLVVAHAPGIPELAERWSAHMVDEAPHLPDFLGWPPATLAVFTHEGPWDECDSGTMKLRGWQEFPTPDGRSGIRH